MVTAEAPSVLALLVRIAGAVAVREVRGEFGIVAAAVNRGVGTGAPVWSVGAAGVDLLGFADGYGVAAAVPGSELAQACISL